MQKNNIFLKKVQSKSNPNSKNSFRLVQYLNLYYLWFQRRDALKKDLAISSKRTKRRRIAEISKNDPSAASVLRSCNSQPNSPEVSIEKVKALIVEADLTKNQYLLIRTFINSKTSAEILPSYEKILKAKTKSYPENVIVSESKAEVELQSLLDHTVSRILDLQNEAINNL